MPLNTIAGMKKDGSAFYQERDHALGYSGESPDEHSLCHLQPVKEGENNRLSEPFQIDDRLRSLGRVYAGIAHEIRNPLSTINVYLSMLRDLTADVKNNENILEIISQIESASRKIEHIAGKVMDFSRPQRPKRTLTDISGCIRETLSFASLTMKKERIEIETDISDNIPECHLEGQSISQVLINLICNAVEAMGNTGKLKHLKIKSWFQNNILSISVSDSGPGISASDRDKIFEPFYTTRQNGTGIGLTIAYKIIRDHGGTIKVADSEWGGAEFCIELPIVTNGNPG